MTKYRSRAGRPRSHTNADTPSTVAFRTPGKQRIACNRRILHQFDVGNSSAVQGRLRVSLGIAILGRCLAQKLKETNEADRDLPVWWVGFGEQAARVQITEHRERSVAVRPHLALPTRPIAVEPTSWSASAWSRDFSVSSTEPRTSREFSLGPGPD